MTEHPVPSSGPLEEIRRLASIAGAEFDAEQAVLSRKRKLFGPLFYSTLVLGGIATVYVGAVRVGELVELRTSLPASNAESVLATGVSRLSAKNWEERAAGARAIKAGLLQFGAGDNRSASRVETVKALCGALADNEAPVRADAADALGTSHQLAEMARSALTAALKDDDPTVRLAVARALMQIKNEPNDAAVRALSDMLLDPTPSSDRLAVFNALRSDGGAGVQAAITCLATLLSSPDEFLRHDGLACLDSLGSDAEQLVPSLEALSSSADAAIRGAAAVAIARVTPGAQILKPRVVANLEAALIDANLEAPLREKALQELDRLTPRSLVRCGRALARQIDNPDYQTRLDAARLLQMISPESLADPRGPL